MQLSDIAGARNLVALFLTRADELGDRPMLLARRDGQWAHISWTEAANAVCTIAQGLREAGLVDGDRVVLVGENRPAWCLADLAIMAAGCVTVPAYTTNTIADHLHVLTDSGARAAIVSNARLAQPLIAAMRRTGTARRVFSIDPLEPTAVELETIADIAAHGDPVAARAEVDARIAAIGREDLACLIYTSGTGGAPKGVRQHHGAILHNVHGAAMLIAEDFGWDEEVFLSFLPLSHAYEHTAGQFLPIGLGARIHYAQSLEKLASDMAEVRPTIMVVVPRLFEMLRKRIEGAIAGEGRAARALLGQALGVANRRAASRPRLGDRLIDALAERRLRPAIRARFGGRLKALVSGGAPLNPDVGLFFESVGLTLLQGYGQTEAGPIVSVNRPAAGVRMDCVGPPLADTEVRIADDGEILVRGELVMHGYWHDDADSAAALADGWLHTGDIGHLDAGGRIVITDRKKDLVVLDKGDTISPARIEGMLTMQPGIAQAMVIGDRRPYLVALIVADGEPSAGEDAVRAAVERVNRELSVTERVRRFALADEPFSIDNGELTPSLKIRRHVLRNRYGARLDALYG